LIFTNQLVQRMSKENPAILFAGFEIGGQMQLLAETMRKRWYSATAASFNNDFRGYQNDIMFKQKGLKSQISRFFFFMWALFQYDIFHFFWGVSLWSFWRFHLLDLPILRLCKKKIVVHFRGLDVVDIKYFDYLRDIALGGQISQPPVSRKDQKIKIKKWLKYADAILVSEPDLHFVSPDSILSPQVIDMSYWTPGSEPESEKDGIIRIVHAPSSRRKKGTDFIESAVENLKKKGYSIELLMAERLTHDKIKELYEKSDIGIDQVLYGWHGKVSVELMALSKPVICYINPEYAKYRPDLPIVNANKESIEQALENLIRNPNLRREIGKKSREYVLQYHDVDKVVDQLFKIYGLVDKTKKKDFIENAKMW